MTGRLAVALSAAAILVVGAPFVGQLRGAIRSAFPDDYRLIIGGLIAVAVMAAVGGAVRLIRDRRGWRYGAIVAALGAAAAYIAAFRTGNPDVDVVEAFHVVEYGFITFLFYRVFHERGDLAAVLLPIVAAFVVGVFDEWMQWFVPVRVGEIRDVWLNAAAIACGLVFSLGLEPPRGSPARIEPGSRVLVGWTAGTAIAVTGLFFAVVHLGYAVSGEFGSFRSRFSGAELDATAADRMSRWPTQPPIELRRFSREDQYLTEGTWHIQARNEAWERGDMFVSWHENAILERFFGPVLDTPNYLAPAVSRWPDPHRALTLRRLAEAGEDLRTGYVSHANPYPIVTWPRPVFLLTLGVASVGVVLLSLYNAPRREGRDRDQERAQEAR